MDQSSTFSRRPQPSTSFVNTPDAGTSSAPTHSQLPLSIQTDCYHQGGYSQVTASDVPDLFYDNEQYDSGYTSPPSAASSSLMPTPLYDWDMPLPTDGPPSLSNKQKPPAMGYSLEQWPSSVYENDSPYHHWDYHPSSSYRYPDELGWEQGYKPEEPTSCYHHSAAPSHCDSHSQPISNSHSTSATYDTQHHKPFIPASSSSVSSASSSTTISPSILMFAQSASSTATSTPTSAVSHLRPTQLHHPRPSRRIPIISLAELASASDEVLQKRILKTHSKSPLPTLSPLPIECHDFDLGFEYRFDPFSTQSYSTTFGSSGPLHEAITCTCGCMGSYVV